MARVNPKISDRCLDELQLDQLYRNELPAHDSRILNDHISKCEHCSRTYNRYVQDHQLIPGTMRLDGPTLPLQEGETLPSGTRIRGYRLVRELDRGGQGVVYEAEQTHTKRPVALKMMRLGTLATTSQQQRFSMEVEVAASLSHPNVVPIYDSGVVDGMPYYSMALLNGRDLLSYVRGEQLSQTQIVEMFVQITDALACAHEHGVIHRDLKPSNILVDDAGTPYLLDFGLARRISDDAMTQTREFAGTVAYASPEHFSGKTMLGTTSDIYSIGVILYQALTGKLPYDTSGSLLQAMQTITAARPDQPSQWCTIDRDLEAIVMKTLEKATDARYRSAAELQADLKRFVNNEPTLASSPSAPERLRRFCLRHRLATLTVAVFALTVSAFTWSLAQERDTAVRLKELAERRLTLVSEAQQRERQAHKQERESQDVSSGVNRFVRHILERPSEQEDVSFNEILVIAESYIEETRFPSVRLEARIREIVAMLHLQVDDHAAACKQFYAAAATLQDAQCHPRHLARILHKLGVTLMAERNYDDSHRALSEALSIRQGLFGSEHAVTLETTNRLHDLEPKMKQLNASLVRDPEVDASALQAVTRTPPTTKRHALALARRLKQIGEFESAARVYAQLLANEKTVDAHVRSAYAGCLRALGDFGRAELEFSKALVLRTRTLPESDDRVLSVMNNLGHCYLRQDKLQQADDILTRTRRLLLAKHDATPEQLIFNSIALAETRQRLGQVDGAAALLNEIEHVAEIDMDRHLQTQFHLLRWRLNVDVGDYNTARYHCQRALGTLFVEMPNSCARLDAEAWLLGVESQTRQVANTRTPQDDLRFSKLAKTQRTH